MVWALIAYLALFTPSSGNMNSLAPKASLIRVANPPQSSNTRAALQLLQLTNQARAQAGVAPLQLDNGLDAAAQAHANEMAAQGRLEHELPGEAPVMQRLAAKTTLHLDRTGENVADAASLEQAQEVLMNSPPHRQNLLNSAYNVAGMGVARDGDMLYVVQDFGHSVPAYSAGAAEARISARVNDLRAQARLPELQRFDSVAVRQSACSMARADSLKAGTSRARYVLRYANSIADAVPADVAVAIADPAVRALSVGACYARTATYPGGVYWVTLLFN